VVDAVLRAMTRALGLLLDGGELVCAPDVWEALASRLPVVPISPHVSAAAVPVRVSRHLPPGSEYALRPDPYPWMCGS